MTHSHQHIQQLFDMAANPARGHAVVVTASAHPVYAGICRGGASSVLEAVLTLVNGESYDEIAVFSGANSRLARKKLGQDLVLGEHACGWWLKRPSLESTLPEATANAAGSRRPDPVLDLAMSFDDVEMSQFLVDREEPGKERVFFNKKNGVSWVADRLTPLLTEIEKRAGRRWRAQTHDRIPDAPAPRCLIIFDSSFLHLDGLRVEIMPSLFGEFERRFSSIPEMCSTSRTDVIMICEEKAEADDMRSGGFLGHRSDNETGSAPRPRQIPRLQWQQPSVYELPTAAHMGGSVFLTAARPEAPLYAQLRTCLPKVKESPLKILDGFHGMAKVRKQMELLEATARLTQEKIRRGGSHADRWLHTMIEGPPGTGKTEVAKVIGKIYGQLGLIKGSKFEKVTRQDLCAGYVGQTATKTQAACQRARGGVLFIDEAYTLAEGGENDFGREALGHLIQVMAEWRDELVCIFAGYNGTAEQLNALNPGFDRRIAFRIRFDDYGDDDLVKIAYIVANKKGDRIEDGCEGILRSLIQKCRTDCAIATPPRPFGNAGEVEKVIEQAQDARALRLANEQLQDHDIHTLKVVDFLSLLKREGI